MFAVLEIEEYKKGFIRSLQRLFEKEDVSLDYCTVKGAVPFIEIKATENKNGINWNAVRNAVGVCSERMLLPEKTEIPYGYGIKRFEPSIYRCIPIFNSMVSTLKTIDLKVKDLNVTVLDKFGALCEIIDSLAEYSRHTTVLTDNAEAYSVTTKRVMNVYGAAIVINDYDHQRINDTVAFADKYDDRLIDCSIVFCAEKNCKKDNAVTGSKVNADSFVLEKKPKGIDTFDFVSALYELNNFRRAREYSYNVMKLADKEISIEEIGVMIERTLFKEKI